MRNYEMEVVNDVKGPDTEPMLRIIDRKHEKQYWFTPYMIIQLAKALRFIDDEEEVQGHFKR